MGKRKAEKAADMPVGDQGEQQHGLPALPSILTGPLGLEGWAQYEPVLLASLASEEPLLLIGPHGSAKSFLLQRLAEALKLEFRFYNASLINYDDLVGIPIPSKDRKRLDYISTASSIWDAQVVFFDEINRTKPELQNKLFPIINERYVQGIPLSKLRFRWSAMNPAPSADNDDESLDVYLGAEPLDPALADRFVYIIEVPGWNQLTDAQRRNVLADQFSGTHRYATSPQKMVEATKQRLEQLKKDPPPALIDYQLRLSEYLADKGIWFSTRRQSMIYRNILAVHAARETLYGIAQPGLNPMRVDWGTSAILAVRHGLPHVALGKAPDPMHFLAAHRHAWQLANLDTLNPLHVLLKEGDPLERCLNAFDIMDCLDPTKAGELILEAVEKAPSTAVGALNALAFYLALRNRKNIAPYIMEALASPLDAWLKVKGSHLAVYDRPAAAIERAAKNAELSGTSTERFKEHLGVMFHAFTEAETISKSDGDAEAEHFARLWKRLNLGEAEADQQQTAANAA